jgi:hypothetical protein
MALPYAETPNDVNFAVDGPRAFATTYAQHERGKRRARHADVDRRKALDEVNNGSTPSFWSNGGSSLAGTTASAASVGTAAHPYEQVDQRGFGRHEAGTVGVSVPGGAHFMTVVKESGGRFQRPDMQTVVGGSVVNIALLDHEAAKVGFCDASGEQMGYAPVNLKAGVAVANAVAGAAVARSTTFEQQKRQNTYAGHHFSQGGDDDDDDEEDENKNRRKPKGTVSVAGSS